MTVEKSVLLSLLKLTQTGIVQKEVLAKDARIPLQATNQALTKLSQSGLFHESKGAIGASPNQRVMMALYALRLGADLERTCNLLSWIEFEIIVAQAFEANSYRVIKNFHFKHASRKWEIDVVGFKKPLVVCVDCKHWKRGWLRAATVKAVQAQIERTKAFADALPSYCQKAKLAEWETATLIPIVTSLTLGPYKFYDDVPIVPILQIQDFINELPAKAHLLKSFYQKRLKINGDLQKFS